MGDVLPGDLTGAGVEHDRQGVVVALPRCRYPASQVGAVRAEGQSGADEILPFEGAVRQRGAGKSGTVVAPQGGAVPWIESGDSCTGEDQRPGWTGGHLLQLREILLPCDGRADARRMPGRTGRGRGGVGLRVGLRHGVQGHGCDHEHDGRHQGNGALPDGCGSRGPHRCGGLLRGLARLFGSRGWADPSRGRGIVGGDAERFTQTSQHHMADDHHPHRQHGQRLGQQRTDVERGMLKSPPPQETLEENQDHGAHAEERDEPSRRECGNHEPDEKKQATTEDEPLRTPGKECAQRQRIVPPHHGQDESRHEGDQPAETRHPEDHHPPCQGASDVVECLGHAPHY